MGGMGLTQWVKFLRALPKSRIRVNLYIFSRVLRSGDSTRVLWGNLSARTGKAFSKTSAD
jgi:hypothetical protein